MLTRPALVPSPHSWPLSKLVVGRRVLSSASQSLASGKTASQTLLDDPRHDSVHRQRRGRAESSVSGTLETSGGTQADALPLQVHSTAKYVLLRVGMGGVRA